MSRQGSSECPFGTIQLMQAYFESHKNNVKCISDFYN